MGAPASVVFRTPFLRYLTLLGCVDVAAKSIARATGAGVCVGMVPDGIAGIFRSCGEEDEGKGTRHIPILRALNDCRKSKPDLPESDLRPMVRPLRPGAHPAPRHGPVAQW